MLSLRSFSIGGAIIVLGVLFYGGFVSGLSVFQIVQGGTGTSTAPTYGKLFVGNSAGTWDYVSTSSLGIIGTADGAFSTTSANHWSSVGLGFSTTSSNYWSAFGLAFSTTSANYWALQGLGFSTTSSNYWASVGLAYSTTSTLADLTTYNKGFFFSTTSANAWSAVGLGFSTTSANFWASVGLGFSTTSSNYWANQGLGFSTTSASYWATQGLGFSTTSENYYFQASTTVPTMYKTNIFTALNTFSAGLISQASSTITDLVVLRSTTTAATTTSLSATTASTTNLWVSSIRNGILAANSTGNISATSTPTFAAYNATSTATSTHTGPLIIGGTSVPSLGAYVHPYARVGTTTCPTNPTFFGYFEVCGQDDTSNGVQIQVGNSTRGTRSFAGVSFLNDRSDTNLTNYAYVGVNGSAYTDTTFGTAAAIPYQLQLWNSMGPVTIASATTSIANAYTNFIVGNNTTANEVMRLTAIGGLGIGTTTPNYRLVLSSSTAPQLSLNPGNSSYGWAFRAMQDGSFALASTTGGFGNATSSKYAFRITSSNIFDFGNGFTSSPSSIFGLGSSTPSTLWGVSIGTTTVLMGGQFANSIASSTTATATETVNWDKGNTQRYILSQSTAFVINSTSSNPRDGGKYILTLCQDPTGSRTATFPTAGFQIRWADNATTTITATADKCTMIGFIYDATYSVYRAVGSTTNMNIR